MSSVLLDEALLKRAAKGNATSFAEIYDAYFAKVYNYVRYRVNDPQAADDLTGAIFEAALAKFEQYDPARGAFAAWLFGIARNTVNQSLRRRKVRSWLGLERAEQISDTQGGPEAVTIQRERRDDLLEAVQSLSGRERELIALKFSSALTNRKIAALTGLTESNVAVILHRALRKLRSLMEESETNNEE